MCSRLTAALGDSCFAALEVSTLMADFNENTGNPGGSDEAFISFAFVIITVIAVILYTPILFKLCKALWGRSPWSSKVKRRFDDDQQETDMITEAIDFIMYVPRMGLYFSTHPMAFSTGLALVMKQKGTAISIYLPRFLRSVFRLKIIILILWVILLSMALYSNLSFDAYAVLGLPPDATTAEVKKVARKLIKRYHPDNNKTEAAKPIYARIRKAYKALVDKDTFEKEAMQEELSAGVALPTFLTSRDNDGLIMTVFMIMFIGGPWWLYRKFSGSEGDKIMRWNKRLLELEDRLEPLYADLGVPEDRKLAQRRWEVQQYKQIFKSLGISTRAADFELQSEYLPPLAEFGKRAMEPEKYATAFEQLGIHAEQVPLLAEYFKSHSDLLDADAFKGAAQVNTITKISETQYDVAMLFFRMIVDEVNKTIDEYNQVVKGNLKSLFLIQRHHSNVLQLLEWTRGDRLASKDVTALIEAPRTGRSLALGIMPEIQQLQQKQYKEQLKQYQKMQGIKHTRR